MRSKFIGIIIFILLFNVIAPNFIYATDIDFDINHQTFQEVTESYTKSGFDTLKDGGKASITSKNGSKVRQLKGTMSFGATITASILAMFYPPAMLCSLIMTLTSRAGDTLDFSTRSKINWYTIEDTVYNKIEIFDADFFNYEKDDASFNGKIKEAVAMFYYITKTIAIIFGLLMLIYVGIRIALSTIASDIAKYKNMLKDWLVSMILIFAMPYIIAIINMISTSLVNIFASIAPKSFEQNLLLQTFNLLESTSGWSYTAVMFMYLIMTVYQVKFFLMYANRMLSMGFLIIISPLITITYSASKTPISGTAAGETMFNKWFKEYIVLAFLQPLHAALYMVFIVSAHEIFTVAPLLAVLFFMGLSRAEKIVKNIFGMRKMASINSMSAYMPIKKR